MDYNEFLADIAHFLGGYYLILAGMNLFAAWLAWRADDEAVVFRRGRFRLSSGHLWLLLAVVFAISSWCSFRGDPASMRWVAMPHAVKDLVNDVMSPIWYTLGVLAVLLALFLGRRWFVLPPVAWLLLNVSLWFLGASLTDANFVRIVAKPDNVPIVGMLYLLGFFTWVATYRAVRNDDRIARGEPPLEAVDDEKVLVWPDLVYIELICMVALTALLIVWAIVLKAPLEEPANAAVTPNPSKAPWYFLGLQELLVYFDPWLAGVVLPGLILFGLIAIPYLDVNPAGSGYYTIRQRPFAYVTFQFGFLVLWISSIVVGTFLRGPGWNFFGIYEPWDPHKSATLTSLTLSEFFWVWMLGRELPGAAADGGVRGGTILLRELPGLLLLVVWFFAVPVGLVIGNRFFRKLYDQMGWPRFVIMMFLLMLMLLVPIKMLGNWTLNLKYVITIPEWSFHL